MSTVRNGTILMTEGNIRKQIILFAIPIFLGNLFQQFYNTADSLIVGNYLGADALAAVSSVGSLLFLFIGFFMGFSTGTGVIVARYVGAQDEEQAQKAVHTSVALALICGALMMAAGIAYSPALLNMMGVPESVFPHAELYLRIYFCGSMFQVMYNFMVGILRASGDSRHPLYYLIASSIVNIILDILFITRLHMGVDGAALATIMSQCLSMVLVTVQLLRTDSMVRLHPRMIRFDAENLKQILIYGIPTALQGSVIDIANILIQSYVNSFGALAMAGIGAYAKIEGFTFLPVTAFSMAMTTFVGQNMGAKKYDRVKEGIRFGLISAVCIIELMGVVMFIFCPQLIGMFISDPEVIAYGVGRARISSLFYCALGFSHVVSAVMRGLGKPMAPMVVMLVCWCAVRVIVVMTIGQTLHYIELTHILYPVTWTLSSIVYILYYRHIRAEVFEENEAA